MSSDQEVMHRFQYLSTALVADAMIRLGWAPKIAPSGIRPLVPGSKAAGPVTPVVLTLSPVPR